MKTKNEVVKEINDIIRKLELGEIHQILAFAKTFIKKNLK